MKKNYSTFTSSLVFLLQNRCNDIFQNDAQKNDTKLNESHESCDAQNNSKKNDFQQNDTLLKGTFYRTVLKL